MIKSIKIENTWSYYKKQEIIFFDSFDDLSKNMNYFFGFSGTGKSSLFDTIKSVIFYMKRWIKFSGEDDILKVGKNFDLKSYFNPNIHSPNDIQANFTNIEIIFANNNIEYKYQLSYNNVTCNYENFYYRDLDISTEWITVFEKTLLSCDFIDNDFASVFKHKISNDVLGIDFNIALKDQNLNNSIFSYVVSFDKNRKIKKINDILDNIIFLEEKDFQNLNEYFYPHYDFIDNKKLILEFLNEMDLKVDDISVTEYNKFTGFYKLNLLMKNLDSSETKSISSSRLSNEERKILLLSYIYSKYIDQNKIIIIDDFTFKLRYSTFEKAQKIIKRVFFESGENKKSQFIFLCSNFFNKTKKKGITYSNIFNIVKNNDNTSSINKISLDDLQKDKDEEINSLKAMLNVTTSSPNIKLDENNDLVETKKYEDIQSININANESNSNFQEYYEINSDTNNEIISSHISNDSDLNSDNTYDEKLDSFDGYEDEIFQENYDEELEDDVFVNDDNFNAFYDNFINETTNNYKGVRIFSKEPKDEKPSPRRKDVDDEDIKKMVDKFFSGFKK